MKLQIVKIIGGLGNQMFQYALFLHLQRKNSDVKLDVSGFSRYTLRKMEISTAFGIGLDAVTASPGEIAALKDQQRGFTFRKLAGRIFFGNPGKFVRRTHFTEPNFSGYYPEALTRRPVYLDGYWQNERYFTEITPHIRRIFQWKNCSGINEATARQMESENSVAVHIRRLDQPKNFSEFLFRVRLQLLWRVCPRSYYEKAIRHITERVENPVFYVFTDRIDRIKKYTGLAGKMILVDWNRNADSHWDLFLMTKCRHNIIAMSSFSWWGAWLNPNPEKIVIAPKKWALRFTKDIQLIPTSWKRI